MREGKNVSHSSIAHYAMENWHTLELHTGLEESFLNTSSFCRDGVQHSSVTRVSDTNLCWLSGNFSKVASV
jgi:hypothetical protein